MTLREIVYNQLRFKNRITAVHFSCFFNSKVWFMKNFPLKNRYATRSAPLQYSLGRAPNSQCEFARLRKSAKRSEFASHKNDLTSLRFRFAIFKMRSLSLRFRNLNRLRIRRAKSAKISLFSGSFFLFFPAQSN
jgi:hypothetical protein